VEWNHGHGEVVVERILVGVDGSACAEAALLWGADLARAHEAELVAVSCRPSVRDWTLDEWEEAEAEAPVDVAGWAEPARRTGVVLRSLVVDEDPREGLLRLLAEEDADLLVVGRAGRGCEVGPGLLQLNSTAEYLAHHADRPLAVVSADVSGPPSRIVVGVDGSDGSRAAVRWVAETATRTGAVVDAVAVWQPVLEWTRSDSPRNWRRKLEETIRTDWAAELEGRDLQVEVHALRGNRPADAMLRLAGRTGADLVVLGMRGLGGFSGLRVGGVALRALHRARITVALVPPTG
jgi:nucleotide-binding universal stress UspA family protein